MRLSLSDSLSFFLILPLSTFLSLFQAFLLLHRVLMDLVTEEVAYNRCVSLWTEPEF